MKAFFSKINLIAIALMLLVMAGLASCQESEENTTAIGFSRAPNHRVQCTHL